MISTTSQRAMTRLVPHRFFTLLLAAAIPMGAAMIGASTAHAAAPLVRQQVAGYYRMMLGDFEVTALLDGTHDFPVNEVMTKTRTGEVARLLKASDVELPVEGPINAFLVNTGRKLILIDSGAGVLYGEDGGHLLANMAAAGYQPEQVDEVYLTHLHKDHVGGVNRAGGMAFPNAVVRVNRVDADYWLSREKQGQAPDFLRSMFDGAIDSLKPYAEAGRLKPFDLTAPFTGDVQPQASPGHTPGHTWYAIESKGHKMVFWGDIVHVAALQFAEPTISVKYDSDQSQAEHERRLIFADAARKGYWIAGAHVAFPGIGHIRRNGRTFEWLPAPFTKRLGTPR